VLADVGQEQLQAVGGARDGRGLGLERQLGLLLRPRRRLLRGRLGGRLGRRGDRLADLETGALELAGELLELLVVQLELGGARLELGRIDVAALLGRLEDGADQIRLEQFVKLVLRQVPSVLSSYLGSCPAFVP
jgi:hypothetical protein